MLYESLEELCGKVSKELEKANGKLSGTMSAGDVEYIDKLTHTLKSIKTTMAMMDADEGYSSDAYGNTGGTRGYSHRTYPRRDSMGRYSRRGYSRNGYSMDGGEMVEELRDLMESAPDERTKREFHKFIEKIENM